MVGPFMQGMLLMGIMYWYSKGMINMINEYYRSEFQKQLDTNPSETKKSIGSDDIEMLLMKQVKEVNVPFSEEDEALTRDFLNINHQFTTDVCLNENELKRFLGITLLEYLGARNSLGERHGKGWAILPNGDQYDGLYRKGFRHGRGLYVFKNGARYLGNYRCGIRSGYGKCIYPDGTVYEGNWHKNQKHGQGTYTYANGDTYSGSWYKGQRHGVGIYKWMDQGVYFEGTWKNGIRVGPCVVQYPKCIFHGCWDYKYPQGPGVFSFDDKHILHGYYRSELLFETKKLQACERKLNNTRRHWEEEEEEKMMDGEEAEEETSKIDLDAKPPIWISQNMDAFDYSLLPQHPVPLPIDDSEPSICDLDSSVEKITTDFGVKSGVSYGNDELEEEDNREVGMEEGQSESETECDLYNDIKTV